MSDPITGLQTHFELQNAAGVLTDISEWCDRVSPSTNTPEQEYRPFKSERAYKVTGTPTEDWDIEGAWTPEAHTFFRAMSGANAASGKNRSYVYGPDGNSAGKVKISGTCNVTNYNHGESGSETIKRFSARISIITQTDATF